jgi:hypothetical protein
VTHGERWLRALLLVSVFAPSAVGLAWLLEHF